MSCRRLECNRYTPCMLPDAAASQIGEVAFRLVMNENRSLAKALVADEVLLGAPVGAQMHSTTHHACSLGKGIDAGSTVQRSENIRFSNGAYGWRSYSVTKLREARLASSSTTCMNARRELAHEHWSWVQTSGAVLRITGPVYDGFWTRLTTVLVHGEFALRAGLPIEVVYQSSEDPYLKAFSREGRDGWSRYFEPIPKPSLKPIFASSRKLQLDCWAAARAWELAGNYAQAAATEEVQGRWYEHVVAQRRRRAALMNRIGVAPRSFFVDAARRFWKANFRPDARVLGVHLRGTDKLQSTQRPVKVARYLPLIKAYLCQEPSASLFVATDDARMLRGLRSALPDRKIVARAVPRSESLKNPVLDRGNENASATAGMDVLLDTLLLSRCSFLLKPASMVSEAATYFSPRLITASFDFHVPDHPLPTWAKACQHRGNAQGT